MEQPIPLNHTVTFKFHAYAETINRIRPEDMGLGDYYFGVRYRCPLDSVWYYKTTALKLNYMQNESNASMVMIDVTWAAPNTFNDAPYGTGVVSYELVICSERCLTWTSTPPTVVYKLPNFIIDGVTYINSGTFTVSNYLTTEITSAHFANSGAPYQSSLIHTSDSEWEIVACPAWLTDNVYRLGVLVTPSNPYVSGDELRIVPNTTPIDNLIGTLTLRCVNSPSMAKNIYVTQDGSSPSSSYFFNDYDDARTIVIDASSYAILVVDATSHLIRWKATSGFGSSNIPVWVRIWCTTHGVGSAWKQISTKDDFWNNTWITTSADLIHNGGYFSIDITCTNPNT